MDLLVCGSLRSPQDARYGPLVSMAKSTDNTVIAANASARHAKLVARSGAEALEELPEEDRELLPPLPIKGPSPAYRYRLERLGFSDHKMMAQCLWDSAMAYNCLKHLDTTDDAVMLVCGRFHLEHFLGIFDHIEESSLDLGRSTFRVVVCVPLPPLHFDRFKEEGFDFSGRVPKDVADFVVFTRGKEEESEEEGGREGGASCPVRSCPAI